MTKEKLFFFAKAISLVGIILAVYLLWEQMAKPAFQPCYINSTVNCDAIISGPVSKTFGIPTPLVGLTGYIIILLAAIFKKPILMVAMSTFGLIFCLTIAYIEIFQLNVLCPVCIACQILMISAFTISVVLARMKPKVAV